MFLNFAWNGGIFECHSMISLITVTKENAEFVTRSLHATLCLIAIFLAFTLIQKAVLQVLDVVNVASTTSIRLCFWQRMNLWQMHFFRSFPSDISGVSAIAFWNFSRRNLFNGFRLFFRNIFAKRTILAT